MAVYAEWNGKTWEVSPQRVMSLEEFSTTYKLKTETGSDAAGKPPSNVRGMDLQQLTFSAKIGDAVGVDVRPEIDSWAVLVGQSAPFLLNGVRFGAEKFMLTTVSVSDAYVDGKGRIRVAKVSFTFLESANEAAKAKTGTGTSKVSGIGSDAAKTALGIAPKTEDKTVKKVVKPGLTMPHWAKGITL